MAGTGLSFDDAAAARAITAIVRHAAAQRDGVVSVAADGESVVVASPGETSLLMARLPVDGGAPVPEGTYTPPVDPPAVDAAGAPATLRTVRGRLQISAGKLRLALDRAADEPVDVGWVWPATEPAVEAAVSRDALLNALPSGEGRLSFAGADKQVVLEAGRSERRLPLKNRTRRRKDIGMPVAFDELRPLVEAASGDVVIGLADLRPLTIESGAVRGMLVRGVPMRWRPQAAAPAAKPAAAPPTRDRGAEQRRRREEERQAREREQEARRRARSAGAAVAAAGRAASQLDAAMDDARQLGDDEACARLADARTALDGATAALRRHLDS
jgi:hypothetical protein